MYFMKKSNLKLLITTMLILFLLVSCAKNDINKDSSIPLESSKYIISLSRSREANAKLLFIKDNNLPPYEYNYDGYSINTINYFDQKLYLSSNRVNEHFILDSNGEIKKYANEYEGKNDKYFASWFTRASNDTLIKTANIGFIDGKYISDVIYNGEDSEKRVSLENQYLNNGLVKNDKLFIESYHEIDKKNGISIIDKARALVLKRIYFNSSFTSSSSELLDFNDKIVTYGNNSLNNYQRGEKNSAIAILDPNTYEINEYTFDKERIIYAYIHNDLIFVFTDHNILYKFNDKLELSEKENVLDQSLLMDLINEKYIIRKIIYKDGIISALYTNRDFNNEDFGFIAEYDANNVNLINKIEIKLNNDKNWLGEVVDFIRIN